MRVEIIVYICTMLNNLIITVMTNERFTLNAQVLNALNAQVLNALQDMLMQSKKHIEFLAASSPDIRTNLESIAESLQAAVACLERQIYFNRENGENLARMENQYYLEKSCKNQAYDFILTENLLNRFNLFCKCHGVEKY